MGEIFSVITISEAGKLVMTVAKKDNSGKLITLFSRSCESIGLLISDVIKPVSKELYNKTQGHLKDAIIVLSNSFTKVLQNRGYIVRDSEMDEIGDSDMMKLLHDMYKIHPYNGTKVINIAPLHYSVDDNTDIKNPIGMTGKRLEGKFQTLFGDQKLVDDIIGRINSEGITIKKFIPAKMSDAKPFLSLEEQQMLSIIDIYN